jgi:hypothetical protein
MPTLGSWWRPFKSEIFCFDVYIVKSREIALSVDFVCLEMSLLKNRGWFFFISPRYFMEQKVAAYDFFPQLFVLFLQHFQKLLRISFCSSSFYRQTREKVSESNHGRYRSLESTCSLLFPANIISPRHFMIKR